MRCMFWCKQMFDGAQHISAPLSMPSMSLGHVHSPTGQHQSPPVSPSARSHNQPEEDTFSMHMNSASVHNLQHLHSL